MLLTKVGDILMGTINSMDKIEDRGIDCDCGGLRGCGRCR